MLMTYQTSCERQETSNFLAPNLGNASPSSSPVQFAFEVKKKKQKYEVRSN